MKWNEMKWIGKLFKLYACKTKRKEDRIALNEHADLVG